MSSANTSASIRDRDYWKNMYVRVEIRFQHFRLSFSFGFLRALQYKAENEELREKLKFYEDGNKPSTKVYHMVDEKMEEENNDDEPITEEYLNRTRIPTTLDPFDAEVVHPDAHYLIKQHFGGKDLLKMSEVSPVWCDMVEVKIGDKVNVRCVMFNLTEKYIEEMYDVILKSNRKYSQISITWLDSPKSIKVLRKFSANLEGLNIDSCGEIHPQHCKFIEFPRLKRLELEVLVSVENWIMKCLWASNCQLEEFSILFDDENRSNYRETLRFILGQHELKRLKFNDGSKANFENGINLLIAEIGSENVGLRKVEHFGDRFDENPDQALILASYMPKLRELDAEFLYRKSDLDFFLDENRFPHLSSLSFAQLILHDQEDEGMIINGSNSTVTKLQFHHCRSVENVLLMLKGLKHLCISDRTEEKTDEGNFSKSLMEFIAVNMEHLETIATGNEEGSNDEEVLEFYEQLKLTCDDINKNIRIFLNVGYFDSFLASH
jgi:hypothetical protein